jgi:hypothetical protein
MTGPHFHFDRGRCRPPTWPALPRRRRVRVDGAHDRAGPHPLMLAALLRARLGVTSLRRLEYVWTGAMRPSKVPVLDRVA